MRFVAGEVGQAEGRPPGPVGKMSDAGQFIPLANISCSARGDNAACSVQANDSFSGKAGGGVTVEPRFLACEEVLMTLSVPGAGVRAS